MQVQYVGTEDGLVRNQHDNQNISEALFYLARESLRAGNYDLAASIVAAADKAEPLMGDFKPQPQVAQFLKEFLETSPTARAAFLEFVESVEAS